MSTYIQKSLSVLFFKYTIENNIFLKSKKGLLWLKENKNGEKRVKNFNIKPQENKNGEKRVKNFNIKPFFMILNG